MSMKFKEKDINFKSEVELPQYSREPYLSITTAEHGKTIYAREDIVEYLMELVVISRYCIALKFDPDDFDNEIFNEIWRKLGDELNELVEDTK